MGKYGIGARVRDNDGDEGVIVGKRKGERKVRYDGMTGGRSWLNGEALWWDKSSLTPIADNDDAPAAQEPASQPKFKVGDRVRNVSEGRYVDFNIGACGTIVECIDQHGFDVKCEDTGWTGHFFRYGIELVANTTPEWQPKVGDRVRFTGECLTDWWFGPHTEHKEGVVSAENGPDSYAFDVMVEGESVRAHVDIAHIEPLPVSAEAQGASDEWVPEVGQRVRLKDVNHVEEWGKAGECGTVVSVCIEDKDAQVQFDESGAWWAAMNNLGPVTEPAPLTVEAGKFYRTRDGRKVGPVERRQEGYSGDYPWTDRPSNPGPAHTWQDDGYMFFTGSVDDGDLVAEWVDEPVAAAPAKPAPSPKFKVGDHIKVKDGTLTGVIHARNSAGAMSFIMDGDTVPGPQFWYDDELVLLSRPSFIVCKLNSNGKPLPNRRPRVHATKRVASAEAQRLAGIYGGEFAVYERVDSWGGAATV
jgi:hypothetical protein